ncbi:hypothetical protein IPM65_06240 [Candidatus Roizmanbacteria bacterium]|nr:MAG: hypothetical protein IPM65_06240 [Candidatus Roizmanbacteria bacterium]
MDTATQELFDKLNQEKDVLQKAEIVKRLRFDREVSVKRIARAIHKHPSYVSHLLRLTKIPQIVVDGYYAEQLSPTHLMILSRLQTEEEIIDAYEQILKKGLTAGQTELLIRKFKYDVEDEGKSIDTRHLEALEKELRDILNAKVTLIQSRVRTKIVLEKRGNTDTTTAFIEEVVEKLKHQLSDEEKGKQLKQLD